MRAYLKWHVLFGGFLVYMLDAVEISILAVSLPTIRAEFGLSIPQAGMLATLGWIGIGLSGLLMGWFADNFGRRGALLLSLVIFGLATAAFALPHASYSLLLSLRFVAGLGLGGVWAILAAYAAETWPPKYRARVTLYILSAYPIGAALAAGFGGALLPNWRAVFLWSGLSAAIPLIYVFAFIPESPAWLARSIATAAGKGVGGALSSRRSFVEIFRGALLWQTIYGTLAACCALFAYIGVLTWLPSYLAAERGLSPALVSRYIITFNAGVFLSYYAFGFIADWIGKRNALTISFVGVAAMLGLYTRIHDLELLLWFSPAVGIFIVFSGLLGAYFTQIYTIDIRATGAGFCFNMGRLVASFSPLVTATVATAYGFEATLVCCAGLFLVAACIIAMLPNDRGSFRQVGLEQQGGIVESGKIT